ncbi:hypothetical protein BN1723_017841, partial [Verticillium longisporum]
KDEPNLGRWKPILSVAATDASSESIEKKGPKERTASRDEEDVIAPTRSVGVAQLANRGDGKLAAVQGMNRPFFHIDVAAAVESATANAEAKGEVSGRSSPTEKQ